MNRRGIEKIMSLLWFATVTIIVVALFYIASVYYGTPYNVKSIESGIMEDQILNCIASQGYLNNSLVYGNLEKIFLADCHLNFSVENEYNWNNVSQYYAEVHVYKFNGNNPGLLGDELMNVEEGNPNIKMAWEIQKQMASAPLTGGRSVNTIVIHSTEGSTTEGALETIQGRALSIHYLIDQNGIVYSSENPGQYPGAFVPESSQAAHAGCGIGSDEIQTCSLSCVQPNGLLGVLKPECQQLGGSLPQSQWCCIQNYNVNSIGIELVNTGNITGLCKNINYKSTPLCLDAVTAYGDKWENFSSAQINSLVNLVSDIAARYNIPLDRDHIVGHYQITTYKTDPGPAFDWNGFMNELNERGAVAVSAIQQGNGENERSFYAVDQNGNQYIVTVLALIGKDEKNVVR